MEGEEFNKEKEWIFWIFFVTRPHLPIMMTFKTMTCYDLLFPPCERAKDWHRRMDFVVVPQSRFIRLSPHAVATSAPSPNRNPHASRPCRERRSSLATIRRPVPIIHSDARIHSPLDDVTPYHTIHTSRVCWFESRHYPFMISQDNPVVSTSPRVLPPSSIIT